MTNSIEMFSVVVPIFNEEDSVGPLLRDLQEILKETGKNYEIIFVDDGSTDNSLANICLNSTDMPNTKVLELGRNYGQTAALAAGIDHAEGDVIITMDGDLQHNPNDIPRLLEKIEEGYDVVSGARAQRSDNFLTRRIPSTVANWLIKKLSGLNIRDFGSTFKAYRADTIKHVELFGELHRFIPALAYCQGAKIIEIPINVEPRLHGQSNYGLRRVFGVFQDLFFLYFYLNYLTKPIRAFGFLFLVFFSTGMLICCTLLALWFVGEISAVWERGALLTFAVFLMIVGVQFLVTGILAELLSRIYFQVRNVDIYGVRKIHQLGNQQW